MSGYADEETPLLRSTTTKRTPVPWFQFVILGFLQLAEPMASQVIYPFAPELIRDLQITHGDESRTGYYVGLLQSVFYVAEAMTILHWSRTSDHIGRRPIILLGLFGLSVSMYLFGLSKTFWGLVLSRCLNGGLNGNSGVMKSMMAELSDHTNMAQVYAYMPIAWSIGATLGPIIGGSLSRPTERFPNVFAGSRFFEVYPYFLPCAIVATFSTVAWLVTFLFLKETVNNPIPAPVYFGLEFPRSDCGSKNGDDISSPLSDPPVPIRSLLTSRVLIAASNYAACSLLDITFRAIQPLFFATPIELGGLGLSIPTIGNILAASGVLYGILQVFFFARIHDFCGAKKTHMIGLACALPAFACFPPMNLLARSQGLSLAVWTLVALQNVAFVGLSLSFGATFIFVAAASPNRASLGSTNGLSQTSASIIRAIGPAAASSLFSLSIGKGYLGGYLVYYVLAICVCGALGIGSLLPSKLWT